jgi:nucleoside-diphosphate-sugar epimerase
VVAFDNFSSTSRTAAEAALPHGAQLVEGDLAEPMDVARAFDQLGRADDLLIYFLAAQPSAARAMECPQLTERANLVGARVLLEAARERQARVIFGGSFRVYGNELAGSLVDEASPYGRVGDLSHLSKIYVEQLARMLGVGFVSVRLGVVYGLSPVMKTVPALMTVPNLFCQRAAKGEPLRVLEDRPLAFIHVFDAADALICAAAQFQDADWAVVNAAPEVATIGQLARTVRDLLQERGGRVQIDGDAVSEAGFQVGSRLAFTPRRSLRSDLGEVLDYFLAAS